MCITCVHMCIMYTYTHTHISIILVFTKYEESLRKKNQGYVKKG